jgi:hypothetical protein
MAQRETRLPGQSPSYKFPWADAASTGASITKKEAFFLAVILLIAGYFRVYNSSLTFFSLDQVRDFWMGWQISTGSHFPLLGTEQQGAFKLGPFFYYLTAFAFWISDSLNAPYVQVGLADWVSVLLCYGFTRSYFGSAAGLLAALLYAVNMEAVFVGRFPGNAGYVHVFVMGYLWLFMRFLESGSFWRLVAAAGVLGLALQIHTSVFFLLPLSASLTLTQFGKKAWRPLLIAAAVILFVHFPLLVSEFQTGFNNIRSLFAFLFHEAASSGHAGYLSRLGGSMLLNSLAGAMLLPRKWSLWFQPFFVFQSLMYLMALGGCLALRMKNLRPHRQRQAALMLMIWLFVVLALYPLYPRINHNYIDALHPGAMIALGAVMAQTAGRLKRLLSLSLMIAAAANLVFLVIMDEGHTRKAGMIRLYRPTLVDLKGLAGSNDPLIETVPAGIQILANELLLEVFGNQENVLERFHGLGRLFFLDENNRFILAYLSQKRVSVYPSDTPHYFTVGFAHDREAIRPEDLPLAGPYYLRRAVPCEAVLHDGKERLLPTWSHADYSIYDLITVRSLSLEKPVHISLRASGQKTENPFRYVLMAAYATKQEAPVAMEIGESGRPPLHLQGSCLDTLPFTRATLFHIPSGPDDGKTIHLWLYGTPENRVDLDAYGEPLF